MNDSIQSLKVGKLPDTFIKFILVGVVNTVFGYSVFALLIFLGLHYYLAVFLATVIGVLFNFKTIGKLVFKSANNRHIFKFIMTYVMVFSINVGALKLCLLMSFNVYIAGAMATIIAAVLSYVLNAQWVFKERIHEVN